MVRELAIFLFLLHFKFLFFLFSFFPLKDKTTFVASFGDNSKYVLEEMHRQNIQVQVAVLCTRNHMNQFKDYHHIDLVSFEISNISHWLKSIYHLATSRYILVDNYYGFLAAADFKEGVQCIQLWHASGALKKFGLEDETIKYRSAKAKQRFLSVYSRFHKVVAGSDAMASVFIKSFNLKQDQILTTGVPRTDFFFDEEAVNKAREALAVPNKKVILYVPTYRDCELDHFMLHLDIRKMAEKLGEDYILFLKLHPAIKQCEDYSIQYPDFVIDVSSGDYKLNELLAAADYLITDYSSILFEFSLLGKPLIFFVYDLDDYKRSRGVIEGFEHNLPGPIASDTGSIIELIHTNRFEMDAINEYAKVWNKYSNGRSSYNLVQYMFHKDALNEKHRLL